MNGQDPTLQFQIIKDLSGLNNLLGAPNGGQFAIPHVARGDVGALWSFDLAPALWSQFPQTQVALTCNATAAAGGTAQANITPAVDVLVTRISVGTPTGTTPTDLNKLVVEHSQNGTGHAGQGVVYAWDSTFGGVINIVGTGKLGWAAVYPDQMYASQSPLPFLLQAEDDLWLTVNTKGAAPTTPQVVLLVEGIKRSTPVEPLTPWR